MYTLRASYSGPADAKKGLVGHLATWLVADSNLLPELFPESHNLCAPLLPAWADAGIAATSKVASVLSVWGQFWFCRWLLRRGKNKSFADSLQLRLPQCNFLFLVGFFVKATCQGHFGSQWLPSGAPAVTPGGEEWRGKTTSVQQTVPCVNNPSLQKLLNS